MSHVSDISEGVGFADNLASFGGQIALIAKDGTTITYEELAAEADRIDLPAERALTLLAISPTIPSIVKYLALLRSRFPVILVEDNDCLAAQNIRREFRPWCIDLEPSPTQVPAVNPDTALLLSTSGSTGSAKLVRLSRLNISSNAESIRTYLDISADDRAITSLPLYYSYGLSVLHSHLAAGASVVLTDDSVADAEFWSLFEYQAVTHLAGVPYSYELFELSGMLNRDLRSLRTLTQAGGRLPPATVAKFANWAEARNVRFFVMYGQTEATARIAYLPPEQVLTHSDCIGVPIPGGTIRLKGSDDRDTLNGPGELIYTGANVMMGYATSVPDLALPAGSSDLSTGDIAERTESGLYRIVGRMNRFSKLYGLRISHDEVERWLQTNGVQGLVSGDDTALAVLVEGDARPGLQAELAKHTKLPVAAIKVAAVENLPRLSSGKLDYVKARELAFAAPAGRLGGTVSEVFAQTFPGVQVSLDDSFVTLGGDSLSYVNFSLALEDVLGHLPADWSELSLRQLEDMALAKATPRLTRSLESDMVIRAFAISSVVLVHAGLGSSAGGLSNLGGGAQALMILFGLNLNRFQFGRFVGGAGSDVVRDFSIRVLLPYMALLLTYAAYKSEVDVGSLLLISAWSGRFGTLLEPYWFIETAAQSVILLWLLFAIPWIRRFALGAPLRFAWFVVGFALLLKIVGMFVIDQHALEHRTLDANFIWLALGWVAASGEKWTDRFAAVLLGFLVAAMDWGLVSSRSWWICGTLATIAFVPRLPIPRFAASPIAMIAGASFMIYLTHGIVIHEFELRFGITNPAIILGVAIAVGVAAFKIQRRLIGEIGNAKRGGGTAIGL